MKWRRRVPERMLYLWPCVRNGYVSRETYQCFVRGRGSATMFRQGHRQENCTVTKINTGKEIDGSEL
jgi:hypothetical protein